MVHITNHIDGCLLMYEQMQKEQVNLHDIQREGQLSLFSQDSENKLIDERTVKNDLLADIAASSSLKRLEEVLAHFIMKNGLTLSLSELRMMVKGFEHEGLIKVVRFPERTQKGKPTTFMASEHGNIIYVGKSDG